MSNSTGTELYVELHTQDGVDLPVGPLCIVFDELFPAIISHKSQVFSADDVIFDPTDAPTPLEGKAAKGKNEFVVTVLVPHFKGVKNAAPEIVAQLKAAIIELLGSSYTFDVELHTYKQQIKKVGATKSDVELPNLSGDPILRDALDRVQMRLIIEDDRMEVDVTTGAISVIAAS